MKKYLLKNIEEISESTCLNWYGFFLTLAHLATGFLWFGRSNLNHQAICWTFFENCYPLNNFIFSNYEIIIWTYLSFILITLFYFLIKKTKTAYFLFFCITLFKYLIHISDYRMMGNYHYMHHLLNFIFLFLPNKVNLTKTFIVGFYFSAGLIKFDPDWLTGSAMLKPFFIDGKAKEIACALVIILELVIIPLILVTEKKYVKYSILALLALFHITSYHIVGWFYPFLMFCFLTIFVLEKKNFVWPKEYINQIFIVFFILAQLYPIIFEPNSALNGRGRILSLNMLDIYSQCETRFFLKFKTKTIEYSPKIQTAVRIHCDPVMFLAKANETCQYFKNQSDFIDIDFNHQVRRSSEQKSIENLNFLNICNNRLNISFLGRISQNEK